MRDKTAVHSPWTATALYLHAISTDKPVDIFCGGEYGTAKLRGASCKNEATGGWRERGYKRLENMRLKIVAVCESEGKMGYLSNIQGLY